MAKRVTKEKTQECDLRSCDSFRTLGIIGGWALLYVIDADWPRHSDLPWPGIRTHLLIGDVNRKLNFSEI